MSKLLPHIELNPPTPSVASVIWLHGLGADGNDFKPIVPLLKLPADLPIRFIFPHAPVRPMAINGGMSSRSWFDIDLPKMANEQHIEQSSQQLQAFIDREKALGMPSYRIILAGFSQGGVVALHTGLRSTEPLAGIMALSTFMPTAEAIKEELSTANSSIPIFLAHGQQDAMIPFPAAQASKKILEEMDYDVEWHQYAMGHEVCPEEIGHISLWLQKILN